MLAETMTQKPRRRSAVEKRLLELGANLAEQNGWEQPAYFKSPESEVEAVRQGAGLFDLSPLTKLDVRAADLSGDWEKIAPEESPPEINRICRATVAGHPVFAARLNPERIFLNAPPGLGTEIEAAMREAVSGSSVGVTDVSSGFTVFELAGPSSALILKKLGPVPLPAEDLTVVQARYAGVYVVILRVDGGGDDAPAALPAYRLHVSRDLGLYFWGVLEDAGQEFGLIPYGTEARSRLCPNVFPG
jgi:sarcosine oxidase subunit alpha